MNPDDWFHDRPAALATFHALRDAVAAFGPVELAVTKSRVSFVRRNRFLWVHEANTDGAVWVGFDTARPIDSPRLRSGARGNKWSHHVKLTGPDDLDAEFLAWAREAYDLSAPEEG